MSHVVNLKHNTRKFLTLKLMPPVDVPRKRAFFKIILLFSLFVLSSIFTPFFSFSSFPSFLLCGCCCVCVRPSMGAVLAAQQSRRLDTHCAQLTLRSQSVSPHAEGTRTHDPLLTDLTPTSNPDGPSLHFTVCAEDGSAPS